MQMERGSRGLPPEEIEKAMTKAEATNLPGREAALNLKEPKILKGLKPVEGFREPLPNLPPAYVGRNALREEKPEEKEERTKTQPIPLENRIYLLRKKIDKMKPNNEPEEEEDEILATGTE